MERHRRQGLRLTPFLQRIPAYAPLELRHRHRSESLPVAVSRRDQDRRLPDGAAAQGAPPAASEPLHRRRYRSREDHRGRPHRARAAASQEGEDGRGRRARVRPGAVEGRDGGALRPPLRDPRPRVSCAGSPGAGLRGQPVAHPQPLSRVPQPSHRSDLRGPHARVARRDAARRPADPGRGASRCAVERRALRHRDEVHTRHPRSRGAFRAPPVPVRHTPQRSFQQLLHPAGAARPLPVHPWRAGPGKERTRRGDGAAPQGRRSRGPRRISGARRAAHRDRGSAGGRARARSVAPPGRIPRPAGRAPQARHRPGSGRRRPARGGPAAEAALVHRGIRHLPCAASGDGAQAVGRGDGGRDGLAPPRERLGYIHQWSGAGGGGRQDSGIRPRQRACERAPVLHSSGRGRRARRVLRRRARGRGSRADRRHQRGRRGRFRQRCGRGGDSAQGRGPACPDGGGRLRRPWPSGREDTPPHRLDSGKPVPGAAAEWRKISRERGRLTLDRRRVVPAPWK